MEAAERPVRWAILGTGFLPSRIAAAIESLPDAELVAVVSRDGARAERFSEEHGGATAFGDLEACLARARPEAVYVGTPNRLHADRVIRAAQSGCHVLC